MHNPRSLSGTEPMDGTPTGTVTFLFTDIEGSTRRWETDPASMRAASSREEAILRHAIGANGGYAYKMIGDAFQAAFPTAPQALQAALDAQHALRSENWPAEAGELKVRMVLHTGATEERGDDYVGPALNRVARILSAAHGGQTLLSQVTHELVRDALPPDVRLVDMGEHRLKDLTRPEHIFQIVAPGLPSDFPPLKTLENRPNNLPLQPTPLIGRERELGEVEKLLRREEVLLVTLTGPGGTGKTRVGLQVASDLLDEFPDGVWYVELAALTDATLVAPTIAQTLSVSEVAGKPVIDTLKGYLREKKLLLVLDNFEQLMDARGAVAALVKAAPDVRVLVTSREKLNVYGEHEYAVPPLSLPDMKALPPLEKLTQYEAVELFIERARAAKADFDVNNDNAAAVAEICIRVDGLPLAIELAAARVKMLPPQALLARLSSSLSGPFKLLTGGARDLSARLQTLRGTIDWSYNLLSDEEKRFFARAAVFQGGRTLEALEAVCNLETLQAGGN
jgi:class 3 adenylate cyclase